MDHDEVKKARWHPAAEAYPLMPEKKAKNVAFSLEELTESIKTLGLKEPIKVWRDPEDSKLYKVDGRNRERACKAAGVEPCYEEIKLKKDQSILDYIKTFNSARRHMTPSQAAMAAADLLPFYEKEAKKRHHEAVTKPRASRASSAGEASENGADSHSKAKSAPENKAAAQAARATGASTRVVYDAKKISRADPELGKKVKDGDITIHQAAKILRTREKEEVMRAAAEAAGDPGEDKTWRIVQGDVIEELERLPGHSVDLIFIDPPYNVGIDYGEGTKADRLPEEEYLTWCDRWLSLSFSLLKKTGTLLMVCPDEYADHFGIMLRDSQFHRRAWIKWYETFGVNCDANFNRTSRHIFYCVVDPKKFTFHETVFNRPSARQAVYNDGRAHPAGKIWDDVFVIPRLTGTAKERIPEVPTQLPLELVQPLVAGLSNPGDMVVDPMCGSGTVGHACILEKRVFAGIEKSKRYAELARLRLQAATAEVLKKAEKEVVASPAKSKPKVAKATA